MALPTPESTPAQDPKRYCKTFTLSTFVQLYDLGALKKGLYASLEDAISTRYQALKNAFKVGPGTTLDMVRTEATFS